MPDPAATLALCAWLKKRIAVWETEAKSSLELVEGERKAAQLNGATVAYTTKVKGRARAPQGRSSEGRLDRCGLLHAGRLGPNGLKELPPDPTDRWTQDTAAGAIG